MVEKDIGAGVPASMKGEGAFSETKVILKKGKIKKISEFNDSWVVKIEFPKPFEHEKFLDVKNFIESLRLGEAFLLQRR